MLPRLMTIVVSCRIAMMLMIRLVVPNLRCGLRNQSVRTPSSATRFRTPLAPMMRCVHRAGENQHADQHDEGLECETQPVGSGKVERQAANQIVQILAALGIRNQHHGKEGNQRREHQAVNENHEAGAFQILQFWRGDFTIYLCETFLAAHREERMSRADQHHQKRHVNGTCALEPAQRFVTDVHIAHGGERHRLVTVFKDREQTPDDQDHHHYGCDLHDAQSFLAGFVNADDVFAPEIERHENREAGGEILRIGVGVTEMEIIDRFVDESGEIQSCAHRADGSGEDVVEQQCRDGEFRVRSAHGFADHAIDAAAHEHAAAFDVGGAHRVRKQHDAENEPGRRFADGRFRDSADVIGRRRQVGQNDRRRAPEGNERQHDCRGHDDLGSRSGSAGQGIGIAQSKLLNKREFEQGTQFHQISMRPSPD